MTFAKLISASFGLLLLTQCKAKEDRSNTMPDPSNIVVEKAPASLRGTWTVKNNNIFFTCELTINDNGTFAYYDRSCSGPRVSRGHWEGTKNAILLISDDDCKKKVQIEAKLLSGPHDTAHLYLDKEPLQLVMDTLYGTGAKGFLEGSRFYKMKMTAWAP